MPFGKYFASWSLLVRFTPGLSLRNSSFAAWIMFRFDAQARPWLSLMLLLTPIVTKAHAQATIKTTNTISNRVNPRALAKIDPPTPQAATSPEHATGSKRRLPRLGRAA